MPLWTFLYFSKNCISPYSVLHIHIDLIICCFELTRFSCESASILAWTGFFCKIGTQNDYAGLDSALRTSDELPTWYGVVLPWGLKSSRYGVANAFTSDSTTMLSMRVLRRWWNMFHGQKTNTAARHLHMLKDLCPVLRATRSYFSLKSDRNGFGIYKIRKLSCLLV